VTRSGALDRIVRRAGARRVESGEHCDLCSLPVPEGHRHVLDERTGELMCACQACSLLFDREAAARGHYTLVPRRRVRLDVDALPESLGVPVGLAFFIRQRDGAVVAHYPSPMGVTQSAVDADAWEGLLARWPVLGGMEPVVEAFLVNTARGADERWLVPIDDCYRLVAVVRREWRGLSGGHQVWPEIERFFRGLDPHARGRMTVGR
jgi:Family of unknown function (DUF5947)